MLHSGRRGRKRLRLMVAKADAHPEIVLGVDGAGEGLRRIAIAIESKRHQSSSVTAAPPRGDPIEHRARPSLRSGTTSTGVPSNTSASIMNPARTFGRGFRLRAQRDAIALSVAENIVSAAIAANGRAAKVSVPPQDAAPSRSLDVASQSFERNAALTDPHEPEVARSSKGAY